MITFTVAILQLNRATVSDNLGAVEHTCAPREAYAIDYLYVVLVTCLSSYVFVSVVYEIVNIWHNPEIGQAALLSFRNWTGSRMTQIQLQSSAPDFLDYLYIMSSIFNPAYMISYGPEIFPIVKPV